MTIDLSRCHNCQTWKDTNGKGNKRCTRCNVWKEILKPMDLPDMDIVPDEVIEQYPDLHEGKIGSILQAAVHLNPMEFLLFCQFYVAKMTKIEVQAFWNKPPCVGYSGQGLFNIAMRAKNHIQKMFKK